MHSRRALTAIALAAPVLLPLSPVRAAETPPPAGPGPAFMTVDTIIEQDCAGAMAHAARLGLPGPTPETTADDKRLRFEWRLSEHAVLFRTDEFDQAQLTSRTTSLVTGRGEYLIRLSMPSHYEHFFAMGEGGVHVEDCTTGNNEAPVSCRIIGDGPPGCFQLGYRLPPIDSGRVGGNPRESVIRNLHLFAGTGAFLSSGGSSKTVFLIPGDYSTASEEPGGHKLDPLASDLSVESDFMFDQATQETALVVGSKPGGPTNATVGLTLYGRSTRLVSERELLAALVRNGRAVLHINFDFDKATLRPDAMAAIDQVTALLKDNPSLGLQIEGHTDGIGTTQHNASLSEARARAVRNVLVSHGIAASRLAVVGMGATQPVADNRSDEGRFKNRRVEFIRK
jgi:outer membrane protein OmpA-like peptidoglycan-associated protein